MGRPVRNSRFLTAYAAYLCLNQGDTAGRLTVVTYDSKNPPLSSTDHFSALASAQLKSLFGYLTHRFNLSVL